MLAAALTLAVVVWALAPRSSPPTQPDAPVVESAHAHQTPPEAVSPPSDPSLAPIPGSNTEALSGPDATSADAPAITEEPALADEPTSTTIRGVVILPSGDPAPTAIVRYDSRTEQTGGERIRTPFLRDAEPAPWVEISTDAQGRFEFPVDSSRTYRMNAWPASAAGFTLVESAVVTPSAERQWVLQLQPAGRLEGAVVDDKSQPVADARVRAEVRRSWPAISRIIPGDHPLNAPRETFTDVNGRFTIDAILPEQTRLDVMILAEGFEPDRRQLDRRDNPNIIRLSPIDPNHQEHRAQAVRLKATWDSPTGEPVMFYQYRLEGGRNRRTSWENVDSPDGTVVVVPPAPGGWVARVIPVDEEGQQLPLLGLATFRFPEIVAAAGDLQEVVAPVSNLGLIRGTVVDATTGQPIESATVTLFRAQRAWRDADLRFVGDNIPQDWIQSQSITGPDGRFEFTDLDHQTQTLGVRRVGYSVERPQLVDVSASNTAHDLRLELQPAAKLSVRVINLAEGLVLGSNGLNVAIRNSGYDVGVTYRDGMAFAVDPPAGEYEVVLAQRSGGRFGQRESIASEMVSLDTGDAREVVLDAGAGISVRLRIERDPSMPPPRRLVISELTGGPGATLMFEPSTEVMQLGLAPGTYVVQPEYGRSTPGDVPTLRGVSYPFTVEAAPQLQEVTLDFQPATLKMKFRVAGTSDIEMPVTVQLIPAIRSRVIPFSSDAMELTARDLVPGVYMVRARGRLGITYTGTTDWMDIGGKSATREIQIDLFPEQEPISLGWWKSSSLTQIADTPIRFSIPLEVAAMPSIQVSINRTTRGKGLGAVELSSWSVLDERGDIIGGRNGAMVVRNGFALLGYVHTGGRIPRMLELRMRDINSEELEGTVDLTAYGP